MSSLTAGYPSFASKPLQKARRRLQLFRWPAPVRLIRQSVRPSVKLLLFPVDGFRSSDFGDSVCAVMDSHLAIFVCVPGRIMNKRAPIPKLFSTRATAVVLIIILLPFAILALSWAFDYVSRAM